MLNSRKLIEAPAAPFLLALHLLAAHGAGAELWAPPLRRPTRARATSPSG